MRLLAEKSENSKSIFDDKSGSSTKNIQKMSLADTDKISSIALQISAFEEDPDYLRECLQSISNLRYPHEKLKVILTIDGNADKDLYHWEVFQKVFASDNPKLFRWDYNFHELPEGSSN